MSKGAAHLRSMVWKRFTLGGRRLTCLGAGGVVEAQERSKAGRSPGPDCVEEFGFYYKSNGESQQVWSTGMQ